MATTTIETKLERLNNIKIVGILKEQNIETNVDKHGKSYASGNVTVESTINGELNTFEIGFYSKENTEKGEVSQLFLTYTDLAKYIGKTVEIDGSLRENRYFSKTSGQIVSAQLLSGRFIKGVPTTTPHEATFEFSGFVYKPLTEKLTKEGKIYAYEMEVGQANYNATTLSVFKFHISPDEVAMIRSLQTNYYKNATVKFDGDIRWVTSIVTQEVKSDFGKSKVKSYPRSQKNYYVTGANAPIAAGETTYQVLDINELTSAYAKRDVELSSGAQSSGDVVASSPRTSGRATRLL